MAEDGHAGHNGRRGGFTEGIRGVGDYNGVWGIPGIGIV
jgi:hypothetical protein